MSTTTGISRRSLVKGATLGAVVLGGTAASALADEVFDSYTYADTITWDAEYDVVVLGMGFAGMVSAMEAADNGASVLIAEKAPEGECGGNSRFCAQMFCYGKDNYDDTLTYLLALAAGREVPQENLEVMAKGIAGMATTMNEKYGFDRDGFVDWSAVPIYGTMSPEYPEFPGSDTIALWTVHDGVSDAFLYHSMRDRLAENYFNNIDVWLESPASKLIQDPVSKAIIGVTVTRNGSKRNVRALNGICVCTGGFECNPKMLQDYLGEINDAVAGGIYNEGDGIKMSQEAGARLWHMSAWEGISGGYFSYAVEVGRRYAMCMPATWPGSSIIVGDWGKRFINEPEAARHGHYDEKNGIWENPHCPEHLYVIFDAAQMEDIAVVGGISQDYANTMSTCATIAEAAAVIGCEEVVLQKTIDDFNIFVEMGEDYECGRDISTMRKFDGTVYYVLPIRQVVLNTQGGPERNAKAEILNLDGNPIPHLYSAGEMGGFTSCMYQGGCNVAECFIMGQIAGANAATPKDPLPVYTLDPKVESHPAHLGDETDLVIE